MPRLAKVVNVLVIRLVKQGTETTGFRIGFTLHSCQYVSSCFNIVNKHKMVNIFCNCLTGYIVKFNFNFWLQFTLVSFK